jgi:formamidopyrimidine-DNA glycosylase
MPELPEVETICRSLENLAGKKVTRVFRSEKKLRLISKLDLFDLKNSRILQITRRARYLIINFDNQKSLIMHLGMSGKVIHRADFKKLKHDHFSCKFNDNSWLIFNDARRFGFVDLTETKNIQSHKMLSKIGPEPLTRDFNASCLKTKLRGKKMNIKTAMMDNKIVAGIGNIYINESLFDAGISPLRAAFSLKNSEIKKLVASIKKIIKKAIELGGSSISDYTNVNGKSGSFQNIFKVYGRVRKNSNKNSGQNCQNCQNCLLCNNFIRKIKQNGRSSFYCPQCQK